MARNLGAIEALNELREDARLCKNRHFSAGDRKLNYHVYCGIPVMIMTIFTGTVLVNSLSTDNPPVWATVLATVLAFGSATLSGLQTFFNFHKSAEGHRSVANRYQEIARRCKHLIQQHQDMDLAADQAWKQLEELRQEYAKINEDAEAFTTNNGDFEKARAKLSLTPFRVSAPSAAEPSAAPNGGPATSGDNSSAPSGPIGELNR